MLSRLYAKWMFSWETALTTRDTNRIVRPLEWGFDWLEDFSPLAAEARASSEPSNVDFSSAASFHGAHGEASDYDRMIAINHDIIARADEFYGYETPTDFRLERRHPQ